VVVAGDLNSEKKQLAPLRAAGLAEAGERAGTALTTWSFGPVRLWLDHVFAPAAWPATDVSTFALPGSDHQGVYAAVAPG
jgi:endonuclease/exonuclease/phosphatase (EEP) superfamily protein YafD